MVDDAGSWVDDTAWLPPRTKQGKQACCCGVGDNRGGSEGEGEIMHRLRPAAASAGCSLRHLSRPVG